MDLNDLRIFQCVAMHGSISKAAQELSYVQSNVTARIKLLERELHTELFYRHNRGMILNTEGKRLLEYANDILARFDEMRKVFQGSATPSGILEIGIVETVIALPELLSSYLQHYPNVDLSLKAGVTEQLLQEVIDFKLDGAFVTGPIQHPLIEQYEVFQEELVIVSKGTEFSLDEITAKPLLLYNKGCSYRERLESWLREEGIVPKKIMEFGTFDTIIGSVAAGIGLTIVPQSTVGYVAAQGTLHCHRVPDPYREVTTVFIRRKDSHITSSIQAFIDEIIKVGSTLPTAL
ncbi:MULTISPECIES: LysR family transcriptional regulator [Paenibacillus]|uniref:HTH-type transcriptional regulator CzcR n=1 Tax=Paenibacillus woosongensis TaxID=307580 RepID=A0ABQ4MQS7_9BACL|nr:LysR family transcriptional regulator [Paenibacillus woosongensis]GIP58354.1 HTH-type transcriptional regulator CzcR [Paenibacillus woosongensis]